MALWGGVCPSVWAPAARADTVVTLAFEGAYLDVAPVQSLLATRGLHATFFANSAMVGTTGRLDLPTLLSLQTDGNEVGGDTAYGLDLFTLDPLEQAREICVDRSWLLASGLMATSFAFPAGIGDPTTSGAVALVEGCGYDAARKTGGLACATCANSVPLPPPDPLRLATLPAIDADANLATLQGDVTNAEVVADGGVAVDGGNGWVILVFNHLCDPPNDCDNLSTPTTTLTPFLDWLVTQESQGVQVKTMAQVIGGPVRPAVAPPPATNPSPDGGPLLQNASLESNVAGDGIPDCWQQGGEGDNLYVFTRVNDAHDGQFAEQIQISSLTNGARRLVTKQDLGECAPAPVVGHRYRISAWVQSEGLVKLAAYTRDSSGAWSYWDEGPGLPDTTSYQHANWITPAVPAGSLGLSVGITLASRGSLTVDQFDLEDLGLDQGTSCATAPATGAFGDWLPLIALVLWCVGRSSASPRAGGHQ